MAKIGSGFVEGLVLRLGQAQLPHACLATMRIRLASSSAKDEVAAAFHSRRVPWTKKLSQLASESKLGRGTQRPRTLYP